MLRKTIILTSLACCMLVLSSNQAAAQVPTPVFFQGKVIITFNASFKKVDPESLSKTYLSFEDSTGKLVQLSGTVTTDARNTVTIEAFRLFQDPSGTPIDLARGGGTVPMVPANVSRTYVVALKGIQLVTEDKPKDKQIPVDVSSPMTALPLLFLLNIEDASAVEYDRRYLILQPFGLNTKRLLDKLKAHPEKVSIAYQFSKKDISAIDFTTTASSVRGNPDDPDPNNPQSLRIDLGRALPRRPEKYTVKLTLPAQELQDTVSTDAERGPDEIAENKHWIIPNDTQSLEAARVSTLTPPKVDRASSIFYFETTFTSSVNTKDGKRGNVGVFGIHLKPTLPILTYNVFGFKQDVSGQPPSQPQQPHPVWMAFRPLLEADFDTQSPKVSKSPNRVMFGMDYELGRDAGVQGSAPDSVSSAPPRQAFLQQLVWINGLRYDSDRDFKLQTMYWHTEVVPRFLNFEQTQEQRFFQHITNPAVKDKQPTVSSYRIRPSIGYELGGIVANRDNRMTGFPTERVSRLLFRLDLGIEFLRVISFSTTDTYYFLENADRRRHRNYLESRFDINTGTLFNIDLAGLQNAITFKFQRGDQPPTFGPVNVFSVGFKIFQ